MLVAYPINELAVEIAVFEHHQFLAEEIVKTDRLLLGQRMPFADNSHHL